MLIKVIEVWEIHYKSGWHHFLGLGPGHHKKEKASWTQCVITPCFLTAYIMWLATSSFCHHDGLYPWTASSINAFFFKMLLSGKFVTETSKVTKTITRKQLVTPMIFIPLLYQWVCLTRSLIIIAPRDLSWVLLLIFLFWQHIQSLWKLYTRNEAFRSVPGWFLHILWLSCVVSSPVGSYHHYCLLIYWPQWIVQMKHANLSIQM